MERKHSESELFGSFCNGDEKAFGVIFRQYYPRLCRFAVRFMADDAAARDAVQTCFMRLWERRDRIGGTSVRPILYTMLRNECLNSLKHRAIVDGYRSRVTEVSGCEELYNADFLGDADHKLLYDELRESIDSALANMPERTAGIFRMSRFEGLRNREIAERLGISTTAVEKHLAKVMKALVAHLRSEYGNDVVALAAVWILRLPLY